VKVAAVMLKAGCVVDTDSVGSMDLNRSKKVLMVSEKGKMDNIRFAK
jgi:hypothetical protein